MKDHVALARQMVHYNFIGDRLDDVAETRPTFQVRNVLTFRLKGRR